MTREEYEAELKILYDGNNNSKGEILKILIKEFESDFTVLAYGQEKTSQLEQVYAQMVSDNEPNRKNKINGRVSKNGK